MKTLKSFTILSLFFFLFLFSNYAYSQFLPAKSTTKPTNFKGIEIEPGTIEFSWEDKSNDESGFLIQINSGIGGYKNYCIAGANETIVVKKPIPGIYMPDYWTVKDFRIIAYKGNIAFGLNLAATYTKVYAKRPDISINSITLNKSSFASGEVCNSQVSLSNIGNLASKNIIVRYYLSNTSSVSNLIDSVIIAPIDTNQSIIVQRDLRIQSTTYGKKNLIVFVQVGYELSFENNNISKEITVLDPDPKPDFTIDKVFLTSGSLGNELINGTYYPKFYTIDLCNYDIRIKNKGTLASSTNVSVLVSKDDKINNGDILFSSGNEIGVMLPNTTTDKYLSVLLPGGDEAYFNYEGIYYLITVLDYEKAIEEKDETNNSVATPIYLTKSKSSKLDNVEIMTNNQIIARNSGKQQKEFKVYPNPCKNDLNVTLGSNDYTQIQIVDVTGRVVLEESINDRVIINLNISNFSKGIYTIVLRGKSKTETEKFIIY